MDSLHDPSEIWRHAYESEISDAGRSMLLALFTLGGKASEILLKPAFAELHGIRADRYGFRRRPEDFRAALRELAGAFIKPVSTHSVEVLDPSVLDLLNRVVREATENAIDLVRGAVSFDQINRVWLFASDKQSGGVMAAFAEAPDQIAVSIQPRLYDERKIDFGGGAIGYRGMTFERRLAILISIAARLRRPSLVSLIAPFTERLVEEWRTEAPDINDGVEILRALDGAAWPPVAGMIEVRRVCCDALIAEAAKGCRSDELRELLSVLYIDDETDGRVLKALRDGFERFRKRDFAQELGECHSEEQFDALLEDLEMFQREIGVVADVELKRTQEAKARFGEDQEDRADHMEDEWKERWREQRASETSVRDMFGSLQSDRG